MKGWKTILYAVVTAALGVVDSLVDVINVPQWYYLYIVPAIMFLLRWLTDGPAGLKTLLEKK